MDTELISHVKSMVYLKTNNGIEAFSVSNIIYFFIENGRVKMVLYKGKAVLLRYSLTKLEAIFSTYQFYRCHAKILINLTHFRYYNHKSSIVVLNNNIKISVAYDRKTAFYQLVNNLLASTSC
jgi:DNA-binding LytR/AlgR family response regulator